MPSLPTRTITGPFSCPAWLVVWVICGARFCDVAGVFSTLSLLTFPVSALVSAALWVKVRTSKFVLGRFSANLDDVGLSPLMFLPRNVRARRGDLWPFSSPHHASCGLSHNLVSFPVSCSVFGEPNLAIGVITLCIFAPATFCTFHPWEIPQSSLRDSDLPHCYLLPPPRLSPLQCCKLRSYPGESNPASRQSTKITILLR